MNIPSCVEAVDEERGMEVLMGVLADVKLIDICEGTSLVLFTTNTGVDVKVDRVGPVLVTGVKAALVVEEVVLNATVVPALWVDATLVVFKANVSLVMLEGVVGCVDVVTVVANNVVGCVDVLLVVENLVVKSVVGRGDVVLVIVKDVVGCGDVVYVVIKGVVG